MKKAQHTLYLSLGEISLLERNNRKKEHVTCPESRPVFS
jgi:hypothetical protein